MRSTIAGLVVILAVAIAAPGPVEAQEGFLFGPPRAEVTVRVGPMLYAGDGDLLDFFRSELTLDRGDFRAPAVTGELALYLFPRVDLALGVGVSEVRTRSESRDWVGDDDLPIEQTTRLRSVPLTASLRVYPLGRGERISALAWIPARTTPYIGAGGGPTWYRLQQIGEFVWDDGDGSSATVFADDFRHSGTAVSGHALAGVQHWLSPRLGISVEGRYTLASATPGGDFTNWDRLDLGGMQVGLGLSYRW